MSDIVYRNPNAEEVRSLNFEYQSGLELMFWLLKLEANELTTEITLDALQKAFDSLNVIKEYPIAEYNSVWHATFGLACTFGGVLRHDLGWHWIMIERSSFNDVGWSMISGDGKLAISIDQVFYKRVMLTQSFDVKALFNSIKQSVSDADVKAGCIRFIDLPCE